MTDEFDVLIAGGGFVGAALACALDGSGLRVAVVEATDLSASRAVSDTRGIALAWGSRRILENLGLWRALADVACPIERIHISHRGRFGATRLDARDENVPALGYVVPAEAMVGAFGESLLQRPSDTLLAPARVERIEVADSAVDVSVLTDKGRRDIRARLVVGADGTRSVLRDCLGIDVEETDYGQVAVVSTITTSRNHENNAWERFTDDGPVAALPLNDGRVAVVWTVDAAVSERVLDLSDAQFIDELQECLGYRLGRILGVEPRHSYPLRMTRAKSPIDDRAVLVGNAAHTLHPVAGQGFNLGLRDVAVLAEVLRDAQQRGEDIGAADVLQAFAQWRKRDHALIAGFTDTLVRVFTNPAAPVALLRGAGLVATDAVPALRHLLCRHTMGIAGRVPRLIRGAF